MNPITIPIQQNLNNAPTDLGSYVSNIVGIALTVAALAAFAYLVLGGLQWITASGDKGKIEEARNRITNAIIGLTIVAVSWAIFLIIDNFFGLGIASNTSNNSTSSTTSSNRTTGVCACANGGCARVGQVSQLSSSTDCYICTNSGWSRTGAPATCPQVITCGACQ